MNMNIHIFHFITISYNKESNLDDKIKESEILVSVFLNWVKYRIIRQIHIDPKILEE